MSYSCSYFRYFTILTISVSGTAGFLYMISRKFFKKQLSDNEINSPENNYDEKGSDINKNLNKNKPDTTKKKSKLKKKKIKKTNKEDENYNPDNEDSSEFSSIKLKKTKEITKTIDSDINSNYEFKISNPINLELGKGSNSGKLEVNENLMIRFSSEKNFKTSDSKFKLDQQIYQRENEEDYFESEKKKELRIKNTREMNKMLNLQKNKLKERLANKDNIVQKNLEDNQEMSKYSKFVGYSEKKLEFSKLSIDSELTMENIIVNTSSTNMFNNQYKGSQEPINSGSPSNKEKIKRDYLPQTAYEKQLKLRSEMPYDEFGQDTYHNYKSVVFDKSLEKIRLPLNFKNNSKSFCSRVVNNLIKKKCLSNPDFVNSYLKNNKDLIDNNKIITKELNIPLINNQISNMLTEELMKNNESTDVIQNKSFISTDRDLNKHLNVKNGDISNNTTLYLINNFKEGKEIMNQTNDIFASQMMLNNKTNFINSFDLECNEDENFSFDLINLYEPDESDNNNKNEDLRINSIFDKRNDVSAINHDNDNLCYFTNNIILDGKGGFMSSNSNNKQQANCRIIESIGELEDYLKKMIEFSFNTNEINNKNNNQNKIFHCTVKTIKQEILNNNEYGRILLTKRKSFEIIDPTQFNVILNYLYNEINQRTIELSEHYKNSRRKSFDDNLNKKTEYISLIKEFTMKRANLFTEVCKEFVNKLNISKKLLFETFVFIILKKNYLHQGSSKNLRYSEENIFANNSNNNPKESLIENLFNSKKLDRYMKLFLNNKLYEKLGIDNIDDIICKITRLNYVGIKEVIAPRILNYDRMMKILTFQNRKIKELSNSFPELSVFVREIMLSDFTYSEYGIDNEAIIAAYKKIKQKTYDFSKLSLLNLKIKNIQYYKVLFLENNTS